MHRSPLQSLAERICAEGADYVVIHLAGEGGLRAAVAVSKDPALQNALDRVRMRRLAGGEHPAALIQRSHEPLVYTHISTPTIDVLAKNSGDHDNYVKLGMRSSIGVPIQRHGVCVGVLAIISRTARRYTEADLPMAQQYADEAADMLRALMTTRTHATAMPRNVT